VGIFVGTRRKWERGRDVDEPLQEVKPLREPARLPEHCGARMRKLASASPATGKLLTVWTCDRCGTQVREEAA
jgi:hypothetical protein